MSIHPNALNKDKYKPTTKQVRKLFEVLKEGVSNVMESRPGSVCPILGVTCYCPFDDKIEQRIHGLVVDDFNSVLGKKRTMKMMAATIFKDKKIPLVVGLVSEAWMVNVGTEPWEEYRKKHLMVSEDPGRIEVVQISACGFYGPNTKPIAIMDCRKLKRIDGKEGSGPVDWDGDWMGHDKPDKDGKQPTPECNILDQFFQAYVDFSLKHEDYKAYLGTVMEAS